MGEIKKSSSMRKLTAGAKVLLVGTGGIGCELLKCLAQAGFKDIEVVDLDTIDVSNLNRQFLFRKAHIGASKAQVARASILNQYPNTKITAHFKNIIDDEFSVSWFKRFTIVMNALDNVGARSHVNRMCLAADVPLIDSGTFGYEGQVEVVRKGIIRCYDCLPKEQQKKYPNCTIRNTPTEMIHCIIWAKHLFNQLFGEVDDEAEVSPDTADPELAGATAQSAMDNVSTDTGLITRVSTRKWAEENDYCHQKLFNKFFNEDILYLLSMKDLWEKRPPPVPLKWDVAINLFANEKKKTEAAITDQKLWSIRECAEIFQKACENLKQEFFKLKSSDEDAILHWDKDDKNAMDFVASCANIRANIFGIRLETRYEIKSMAGNIVPAIATSNTIIAGLVIFQAMHILRGHIEKCKTIYLRVDQNHQGEFINPETEIALPNPQCYACSQNPEVTLYINDPNSTVGQLKEDVFKKHFKMIQPEVTIRDSGAVIISEDIDEGFNSKLLTEIGVKEGTVLVADDDFQTCSFSVYVKKRRDDVTNSGEVQPFIIETHADFKNKSEDGVGDNSQADGYKNNIDTTKNHVNEELVLPNDPSCKRSLENGDILAKKKLRTDV